MGCAASRPSSEPPTSHHHHHRSRRNHPSNTYYDWNKEEGGYIPYRSQVQQRRQWRHEDKEARAQKVRDAAERERNRRALVKNFNGDDEKAKLVASYREQAGRKRTEAYRQQGRDEAEREGNREALRFYDVHEKKGSLRRLRDEEGRRKGGKGKTEKIKVYASPDLKSRWSG